MIQNEINCNLKIESDIVVLAAGSWCSYLGELAGVSIPVMPVLGLMWSTSIQKTNQVKTLIGSMESDFYWNFNPTEAQRHFCQKIFQITTFEKN